jgi:hypothetical protein
MMILILWEKKKRNFKITCTARVFRSDSPGKVAQCLARSIREIWGVLWLVIRLLSVRADVSSSVIKAFFLVQLRYLEAAQWLARSIRESWAVLWLVINLLSVRADVSSSVIKAFFFVQLWYLEAAQWLARSICESWGVLWLVIHLLSVQADVSSLVIKAFFLVQLRYLEVTVQENLRSGWPGPFVKVEGVLWFICRELYYHEWSSTNTSFCYSNTEGGGKLYML